MSKRSFHVSTGFRPIFAHEWKRSIPWSLVMSRLFLCPLITAGAWSGWNGQVLVLALTLGFLSDIFDGVIARRLGTATADLRRADSMVDVVFWLSVMAAAQFRAGFIERHFLLIGLLMVSEAACHVISQHRFARPPATHSYAAKCWGILLFFLFASVFQGGESTLLADAVLIFGLLVNIEIVAIMLLSRQQPVDVPSILSLVRKNSNTALQFKDQKKGPRRVIFGDRL